MLWVILFSSEPVLLERGMGPILEVSIGLRDALRDIRE
jgi:hypothetical protein